MRIDLLKAVSRPVMILPVFGVLLAACTEPVKNSQPLARLAQTTARPAADYIIAPGDQIAIKFFYNPELNEEKITVRPDGNISLQLIGQQEAAGLTPSQLEGKLQQAYAKHLRQSDVAVIVSGFEGQRAYIGGEVGKPGIVPLFGATSALQAIAAAGGFTPEARTQQVILIRKGAAQPILATLNMDDVLSGSNLEQDVSLQPNDVVYVPRSAVADVNLFVKQYIRDNIPIPFGLGYSLNGN